MITCFLNDLEVDFESIDVLELDTKVIIGEYVAEN